MALEHVEQLLEERLGRHERRLVELLLSDVVVVVHRLKSITQQSRCVNQQSKQEMLSKMAVSSQALKTGYQDYAVWLCRHSTFCITRRVFFSAHLHESAEHVDGGVRNAVVVPLHCAHNLHSNPLPHPVSESSTRP